MSDEMEVGRIDQLKRVRDLDIISIPGDGEQQEDSSHI